MRFLLFDRILSIEPGRRIETVKCISLSEEFFRGHFPRRPLFPSSLLLEMMAQTLGRLVIATHDYALTPFLSMVEDATLPADLGPGREVRITGEILSTNPKGTMGRAECVVAGAVVARAGRVLYGHYRVPDPEAVRRRLALAEGGA